MHFGKSPNDPWYWEAEQLHQCKDDPKCLNDKMSGGGPLYNVHGRKYLLDEGFGKIVKDTAWNEDTELWKNPFFEVRLDTINNLYDTYRVPTAKFPQAKFRQSRFFDIIEELLFF